MTEVSEITEPYSALAEIYDTVMENVDYELWADFIDEIIQTHRPGAEEVLELACGTGGLTFELEKLGYRLTAGDKSPEMIEKAREKAEKLNSNLRFTTIDFLEIPLTHTFDVVVSVFDSVNYLIDEQDLLQMFGQVQQVMDEHSIFIFDFTTPQNSKQSIDFLNNREGATGNGYHYFRKNWYDDEQQIHYNSFTIEKRTEDGENVIDRFAEIHRQRTYQLQQIENIIAKTDFTVKAKYGEFSMEPADSDSFRITMVLKWLNTQ